MISFLHWMLYWQQLSKYTASQQSRLCVVEVVMDDTLKKNEKVADQKASAV